MTVATKFVFLTHIHEYKKVKLGTGRLAALSLAQSELHVGVAFDQNPAVQSLLHDPRYRPMLLYPGPGARNLSEGALSAADLEGKRLLVFLLDATWILARKMLRLNPGLQALPRIMFTPREKSRFVIKRQPRAHCLSTLEAVHELMLALDRAGLDRYERPHQLLAAFDAMQAFQIECARTRRAPRFRRIAAGGFDSTRGA